MAVLVVFFLLHHHHADKEVAEGLEQHFDELNVNEQLEFSGRVFHMI